MPTMLRPMNAGPLVGHVSSSTARIWGRAAGDNDDLRTVGIAARWEGGAPVAGSEQYFRLHREYDRTGIVDFAGLAANAPNVVRMASLTLDSTQPDLIVSDDELMSKLPPVDVLARDLGMLAAEDCQATFRTYPDAGYTPFTFLLGSCRYPGIPFLKKRSDEMFKAIRDERRNDNARFMLMVGDQIYADELNRIVPLARADTWAEFHDRYLEAFTSPYFKVLTRSLPTYMILDDHEIEDNWIQSRIRVSSKRTLFMHAMHAYQSYQWLHGPRNYDRQLYYSFDYGNVPFFTLDLRTHRIKEDDSQDVEQNHMLGYPKKGEHEGQLDIFLTWLADMQKQRGDVPKFVVSSSVFAPNDVVTVKRPWKSDAWPAYPATRRAILDCIVANGVQNVVFLCGDVHSSNVAELELVSGDGDLLPLKAFVITSSALYWPFPFADGEALSFVHDSRLEGDGFALSNGVTMHYRARAFVQDDNYARVTYDPDAKRIEVEQMGKKGQRFSSNRFELG